MFLVCFLIADFGHGEVILHNLNKRILVLYVSCVFLIADFGHGEVIFYNLNKVQYPVWISVHYVLHFA